MKSLYVLLSAVMVLSGSLTVAGQEPAERRLPDGTRIPVRLMQRLSSETAKTGEAVTFEVLEDIIVGNQVVIRQGTPARGVIIEAAEKRRMGRAGKLSYSLTETKSVDHQTIRLRANQQKTGGSNVTSTAVATTAVAVFVPVAAPFVLLRKGKDLVVAEGTRIEGFVDGDHMLQSAVAETAIPGPFPASAGQKLTNSDVIGLHTAGFGDDVVVAKIEASASDFNLAASDLISLKKAGISERVVTAMLRGRVR
jgi:hypothetical protein